MVISKAFVDVLDSSSAVASRAAAEVVLVTLIVVPPRLWCDDHKLYPVPCAFNLHEITQPKTDARTAPIISKPYISIS
jgi:hypothetical protein